MKAHTRSMVIACGVLMTAMLHAQQSSPALVPGGEYDITGVVVDSVGSQPLGGVSVRIAPVTNQQAIQVTRTGADGGFSFHRLARGKYALMAAYRGYPEQGFNEHEAFSTAIAVGPALDTEHIVFRLQPEASIRGKVVDEDNEPVQNAMVRLFTTRTEEGRLSARMAGMTTTDDRGYFWFAHLREGAYYLAVSGTPWYANTFHGVRSGLARPGETSDGDGSPDSAERQEEASVLDKAYPLTFYDGVGTSAEATALDLQAGQKATADITLRAVPAVHVHIPPENPEAAAPDTASADGAGTVRFATLPRHLPRRVQLFYSVFDDTLINAQTTMSGSPEGFDLGGIAPGHYVMQVISPGQGEQGGSYQEVDLAGDMELPAAAMPMAVVSGTVQFEGNRAPAGLSVALRNRQFSRGYGTSITGNGSFRFDQPVLPGRYEISVGSGDEWYLSSISVSGAKRSGRTLEISSEPVRLTLTIGHGLGRVDGVAVREGKPWAGAMILLVPGNAENNSVLFRRDQSDSDGTFTLAGVVPGSYTLVAIENGWRLPWLDSRVLKPYLQQGQVIQIAPGARAQGVVEVQQTR